MLPRYAPGARSGVDAAKAKLPAAGAGALLVFQAFFVNTPPKVVAGAFECFSKDLARGRVRMR